MHSRGQCSINCRSKRKRTKRKRIWHKQNILCPDAKINEYQIYFSLKKFNPAIDWIPQDDVLQEIRLAILIETDIKKIFNKAARNIYRLLGDYGFLKKGNKEVQMLEDAENIFATPEVEISQTLKNLRKILDYYEEHTVKETAEKFGFKYTKKVQHAFNRYFPKHCGWGGKRR